MFQGMSRKSGQIEITDKKNEVHDAAVELYNALRTRNQIEPKLKNAGLAGIVRCGELALVARTSPSLKAAQRSAPNAAVKSLLCNVPAAPS